MPRTRAATGPTRAAATRCAPGGDAALIGHGTGAARERRARLVEAARRVPAASVVAPALAAGFLLFAMARNPARWADAAALNLFLHPQQLGRDPIFFEPRYFSLLNPYYVQHRLAWGLAELFGTGVRGGFLPLSAAAAVALPLAAVYLFRAFGAGAWREALLLALVVLNVHVLDFGTTELVYLFFVPHNLATAAGLVSLGAFLRGRNPLALKAAVLTLWLHVPTGLILCLPLGLGLLASAGPLESLRSLRRVAPTLVVFLLPLALLSLRMLAADGAAAEWMGELARQMAAGHVSMVYRLALIGHRRLLLSIAGALALLALLAARGWSIPAAEGAAARRRAFWFTAGALSSLALDVVLVDVVHLSALYPLQLLRLGHFPSFLLLAAVVAEIPPCAALQAGPRRIGRPALSALAAGGLIALLALWPSGASMTRLRNAAQLFPQPRDGWEEAARATRQLPGDSCVLVPYERIDFYSHSTRVSPFNRAYFGFLLSNTRMSDAILERADDFIRPGLLPEVVEAVARDPTRIALLRKEVSRAWRELSPEKLQALADAYGITHVIAEAGRALPGRVVYRNSGYALRALDAGGTRPPCAMPPP